jgi:hypothetical protein
MYKIRLGMRMAGDGREGGVLTYYFWRHPWKNIVFNGIMAVVALLFCPLHRSWQDCAKKYTKEMREGANMKLSPYNGVKSDFRKS